MTYPAQKRRFLDLGQVLSLVSQAESLISQAGSKLEDAGVGEKVHDQWAKTNDVLAQLSKAIRLEVNLEIKR